mmetsp:Transcript_7908/g.14342  ORF Transcript_7908/g.14342 Transcript_7908/m.14342 type:complete len:110 (-) Transcript_7908:219-548(-)
MPKRSREVVEKGSCESEADLQLNHESNGGVEELKCESCKKIHDGNYGSGRFCSAPCARLVGGHANRRKLERRFFALTKFNEGHKSSELEQSEQQQVVDTDSKQLETNKQ